MISDFIRLIFPLMCPGCQSVLLHQECGLCTRCLYYLPATGFSLQGDNPVSRLFWGRVYLEYATAVFHFTPGGRIQKMMHRLKYRGDQDVGRLLGQLMGYELKNTRFSEVDIIVPVPLHHRKLKSRGYNQSGLIAEGLGRVMKIPVDGHSCCRIRQTESQTNKSRYERWQNVSGMFSVRFTEQFQSKHVLLVDDVVTTGATLEACAGEFLKIDQARVSVATVAVADMLM